MRPASERAILALAAAASLLFNLATAARFPIPWLDEVMFTDPAANLLLGRGFTSSAWFRQTRSELWAGYPPLYSLVLSQWMRVFGFGVLAVRSLDYVLIVLAAIVLWLAVARLRLVSTPPWRLALVAVVLVGYGTTFCQRSARVDCLAIVECAAVLLACSIPAARRRCAAIAALAVLLPLTGLQLVVLAALLAGLLGLFLGRAVARELAALAMGIAAGLGLLYAFYAANGVWDAFVASTVSTRSLAGRGLTLAAVRAKLARFGFDFSGFYKDPSFAVLLVTGVAAALWRARGIPSRRAGAATMRPPSAHDGIANPTYAQRGATEPHATSRPRGPGVDRPTGRTLPSGELAVHRRGAGLGTVRPAQATHGHGPDWLLTFGLVVSLVVPVALFVVGVYPIYYSWMSAIPLAIGLCAAAERGARPLRRLIAVGLAAACGLGMPLVTAWVAYDWRDRDYARVEQWARDAVGPEDRVFIDYPVYYAVKPRVAEVYTDRYLPLMTADERAGVTALLVAPAQLEALARDLGGAWRAVGPAITSRKGRDSTISIWGPRYDLALYRRE